MSLQHWLLIFETVSVDLQLKVADFVEWLTNRRPSWTSYREFMRGRIIVLNKQPGVRLVGVGETWCRIMAKCVFRVTGKEDKAACGTEKLAGGVEAGIGEGIHAMRLLLSQKSKEYDWSFLLDK